jgi:hypothetical protein
MPPRKAPLKGSSLSQKARKPINRKPMISRPRPVTPEEREARRILEVRSGGVCEGCRRQPATDWAHRLPRSGGGRWTASNGLHLCRIDCHAWQHANGTRATEMGWTVPRGHNPADVPVWLPAHGWALLNDDGSLTPTAEGRTA